MTRFPYWRPPTLHRFGDKWMTAKEIAEATGLRERTVHRRIQSGVPIDGPLKAGRKACEILFRGENKTIAEIALVTGLSRTQVSKRTDGVRFFEKWELKDPNADPHPLERRLFYNGINDSISGWARRVGIPGSLIGQRIDTMGWSIDSALTTPVRSVKRYAFNGENLTLSEWSKRTGIKALTLRDRIVQYGWPIERALTRPVTNTCQRKLRDRNAIIIGRLLDGFRASSATGGYSTTSHASPGTGLGRHANHLQTNNGAIGS